MADKTTEVKTKPAQEADDEAPERSTPRTQTSGYRPTPAVSAVPGAQGGSGVQRSHLRDRKTWLKKRQRGGKTWMERKVASLEYCPAKRRAD
jgi:hypothetical protein